MEGLVRSFEPIVDTRSHLVVLGSLPSTQSIIKGQYYGNPLNDFWRIISAVYGIDIVSDSYEHRVEFLLSRGIGLWDVLRQGIRDGSKDSSIREPQANDIDSFLEAHPRISTLLINGGAACRYFNELVSSDLSAHRQIRRICLPSTSSANRGCKDRLKQWEEALLQKSERK